MFVWIKRCSLLFGFVGLFGLTFLFVLLAVGCWFVYYLFVFCWVFLGLIEFVKVYVLLGCCLVYFSCCLLYFWLRLISGAVGSDS